ncbi:exopolysaccharide biosynthesis protein [Cerasicoccus fimbriatus]|uniref:exopolysaccharide biosynthesis protein n=1 Tax=Cerasicoccus fimbriatus TaxID=3014554 RepID=UPI0022B55C7F|nr:exopolysaccharide biosynthesis protein [Cerasicoccus sp. TK19100]
MSRLSIQPPNDINLARRYDASAGTEAPFPKKRYLTPPHDLSEMLDRLEYNGSEDKVTIASMMDSVGRRGFGPLMLIPGLIAMSPLSGIPTLPSILGVMVVLIAGQLLIGKKVFWLPRKILDRSVDKEKFDKGIGAVRPVARFVDKLIGPRLTFLTQGPAVYATALICVVVGATMPPLEILPFLATTAGSVLTIFSLSLIARDGLLALIGYTLTGGLIYLVVAQWPF